LLWKEISQIKQQRYPFEVTFSPDINSAERLDLFYHHPEILFGKRCNDAYSNIMIKSNGDIIPAHGRCYQRVLGNLHEQPLHKIWNSAVAAQFRSDLNSAGGLLPACARCCSAF
jgi:Fe-coproporphyrin III synthase